MNPAPLSTFAQRMAALEGPANAAARQAAILEGLGSEQTALRDSAIAWAARALEPLVLARLMADGEQAILRNSALAALERQGPYAVAQLEGMLRDPDPDVVMFACQVLGQIGAVGPVPAIIALLDHAEVNVRQAAVESLGKLRAVQAVPRLITLIDGDLWLQLAAVDALGQIGDARATPALLKLLPASPLAKFAAEALGQIADLDSLLPLLALLRDAREDRRREPLLRAVGAVLDRHPSAAARLSAFKEEVERDRSEEGLWAYLAGVLLGERERLELEERGPELEDDRRERRGAGGLIRAAGTLAVAARLESLFARVVVHSEEPEALEWLSAVSQRFPDGLSSAGPVLLGHPDPRVRRGVLLVIRFHPASRPQLIERLEDAATEVRAAACVALGRLADPFAIPALMARLRSGTPKERTAAAEALGQMPPETLGPMGSCLEVTGDNALIAAGLTVLEHAKCRLFDARVLDLAHAADTRIRRAALRVVVDIEGSRAEVVLLRALADRDTTIQAEVLDLLVKRGGAKVVSTLLALLGSGDSLRYHVIRALGRLRAPEASKPLETLFGACQLHERIEIVSSLIRIAPPELQSFLRRCLEDSQVELRRVAAQGLAGLAGPADFPLLSGLAEDRDWTIRNEAARGLGRLGSPEARQILLTLARDLELVVARTARAALAEMDRSAPPP